MTEPTTAALDALMEKVTDYGTARVIGRGIDYAKAKDAVREAALAYGREERIAELWTLRCGRWGDDPEYSCFARLARGETLFGNEPCARCQRLAELRRARSGGA